MADKINTGGGWHITTIAEKINEIISLIETETGVSSGLVGLDENIDYINGRQFDNINALSVYVGGDREELLPMQDYLAGAVPTVINSIVERINTTLFVGTDTIPAAFAFTDVTGQALNTWIVSDELTLAGTDKASPISIVGGEYSIAGKPFTSADGLIAPGELFKVRVMSSGSAVTATTTTLTIGTVSDVFSATTA